MTADDPTLAGKAAIDETEFEDLVARCLELNDSGGTAAVDEYLAGYPEQAARVRLALSRLQGSGLLNVNEHGYPTQLGEFRLLRKVGGGGMGVVFLARQESLDREVALKIVRSDYLYFGNAKKRFQREVLAVSRLQHPGIVPIWHVGEEDGLPYFAMDYVPGCSLGEVLERAHARRKATGKPLERRGRVFRELVLDDRKGSGSHDSQSSGVQLFAGSWEQVCLRITLRVAEAIGHAHEQQIVHRDIKPSNVMITADGQVKLVDFGLATSSSAEKLTQSNALLGSLHYMSPEQIRHDEVDERTDIYSLGVTLYELLALDTPFGASDPARLREDILHAAAPPLRRRVRSVSRDTETVCEKAMAALRTHRYESMQAFADDLRNLLELRPIHARPPSLVRRTTRWVQRHALLSMALFSLVILSTSSTTLWWLQRQANADLVVAQRESAANLAKANKANAQLVAANARAQAHLDSARRAIESMLTRIANSDLAVLPRAHGLRERVLKDAIALYEELAVADAAPSLQIDLAELEAQIGDILTKVARYDEADRMVVRALARMRRVVEKDPTADHRFELGNTLTTVSQLRMKQRRVEDAIAASREAIQEMEVVVAAGSLGGNPAQRLSRMAKGYRQLDNVYRWFPEHRPEGARDLGKLALDLRVRILREYPEHPQAAEFVADEYRRRGAALKDSGKVREAIAAYERALEVFAPLDLEKTSTAIGRSNFALVHHGLGIAHERLGQKSQAREWYRKEAALLEVLVNDHPEFPQFASSLGGAFNNLARLQLEAGEVQAADQNVTKAIAAQSRALAVEPKRKTFRFFMRNHLYTRCQLDYRLGRFDRLLEEAGKLATYDIVRGRGHMDAAVWVMHAALGYGEAGDHKRLAVCRTRALGHLESAKQAGFLKPQYLRRSIFRPLAREPRFVALQ